MPHRKARPSTLPPDAQHRSKYPRTPLASLRKTRIQNGKDEAADKQRLDAVYIAYWSLGDPLFESQSLPVVRALTAAGWRLAILTFEQPSHALPAEQRRTKTRQLAKEGILWRPLRYHKRPRVLSTLLDVATAVCVCLGLSIQRGVRAFHGRGTVPAAIGWVASALTGARLFVDADGPLSQEYVDAGIWEKDSIPEQLSRWAEVRCLRAADTIAVLTEHRRQEVKGLAKSDVVVVPCGVDVHRFARSAASRAAVRANLGLSGVVFVYAGKTGGWYLLEPMLDFVASFLSDGRKGSLLVLTSEDPETFLAPCRGRGVSCVVRRATHEAMPHYLSAADVGLSFILPSPSKAACSPVKNGEYLACGLPVVTTSGIGDYSRLIREERVGVTLRSLDNTGLQEASSSLRSLLCDPDLSRRCRDAARRRVGHETVVLPRYMDVYTLLLGRPGGRTEE